MEGTMQSLNIQLDGQAAVSFKLKAVYLKDYISKEYRCIGMLLDQYT